ncbi:hypothetical protein ES703_46898 [subsurface metagenome]
MDLRLPLHPSKSIAIIILFICQAKAISLNVPDPPPIAIIASHILTKITFRANPRPVGIIMSALELLEDLL